MRVFPPEKGGGGGGCRRETPRFPTMGKPIREHVTVNVNCGQQRRFPVIKKMCVHVLVRVSSAEAPNYLI